MTPAGGGTTATVLARYRAGGAVQQALGLVRVRSGRLTALVPVHEDQRARALLAAADDLGLVSARALARLFPGEPRAARSVHLRTALGWIGAHVVAS